MLLLGLMLSPPRLTYNGNLYSIYPVKEDAV